MVVAWESVEDNELLNRIQEGSHHAFSVLVQRHANRFYRVAYRYTSDREEAEDYVQDAFVKLWEQPDMWKAEKNAKFTTWFYRVVVNRCLDGQKKMKELPLEEEVEHAADDEAQDSMLAKQQEQKALEREVRALPERQRTALNLCFYEELSNQEAADIMGLNLKALQSLLMRAKTTLKERMNSYLGEENEHITRRKAT